MMKILGLVAGMLFAGSVSALPITYDFIGSSNNLGTSPTFTQDGVDVGVTAISQSSNTVTQHSVGLAIGNRFIVETHNIMSFNFDNDVTLLGATIHVGGGYNPNAAFGTVTSGTNSVSFDTNNVVNFGTNDLVFNMTGNQFDFAGALDQCCTNFYSIRSITIDTIATDVPEPGTLALFSVGLVGLVLARKRAKLA